MKFLYVYVFLLAWVLITGIYSGSIENLYYAKFMFQICFLHMKAKSNMSQMFSNYLRQYKLQVKLSETRKKLYLSD